jgi:hypothetical protein
MGSKPGYCLQQTEPRSNKGAEETLIAQAY